MGFELILTVREVALEAKIRRHASLSQSVSLQTAGKAAEEQHFCKQANLFRAKLAVTFII